jgi:hypothetical protein
VACTIQRLTGRDVPAMRELTAMFAEAFEDSVNYESRPPSDVYLRTLLDRPDVIVLSATSILWFSRVSTKSRLRRVVYLDVPKWRHHDAAGDRRNDPVDRRG